MELEASMQISTDANMVKERRVWISWEKHRRTRVLANHFDFEVHEVVSPYKGLRRYLDSFAKSFRIVRCTRPKVLVVQNPSMVLALFGVLAKPLYKYRLVVDRHTNFKFGHRNSRSLKWLLFFCLSRFTLKRADITIVTNRGLARVVKSMGGTPFVLQDKLPELWVPDPTTTSMVDPSSRNILFVCSFGNDEPIEKVIRAFSSLEGNAKLYITGNWKRRFTREQLDSFSENIVFTGFVSDDDFLRLMNDVNSVMVFTENEFTLNCGAYEALALNKPLMLSNTIALRTYFGDLAVYCDLNDANDILSGLQSLKKLESKAPADRKKAVEDLHKSWLKRALDLEDRFKRATSANQY